MSRIVLFLVLLVLASCGGAKEQRSSEEMAALTELMEGKAFEFEAVWAMPLSGQDMTAIARSGLLRPGDSPNRINLLGNPNYLRVMKDSVSGHLPYYGTQQLNVQFNATDQAITFDEPARDLKVKFDERKEQYEISFNVSAQSNGYRIFLTVFPGMSANLRVNSASRNFISYQGKVGPLREDPER